MEKKKKPIVDKNRKAFIYEIAEAILQNVEGVEQIMYSPKEEFSSQIQVLMKNGIKYVLSVNAIERPVDKEFDVPASELH